MSQQLQQEENSITAIREYFEHGTEKLKPGEFTEFWKSLSEEEKIELKRADLSS